MRARTDRARLARLLNRLHAMPTDPKAIQAIIDRALAAWEAVVARHCSGEARLSPVELQEHLKVLDVLHEAGRVAIGAPPSSMSIH